MTKNITIVKLYLNAFLPPVIWASIIFILSHQQTLPGPDIYLWRFMMMKLAHITVYFILYLLFLRGFAKITFSQKKRLILPVLICIIYAISDELHQSFIPHRSPTFRDIGFDSLGVLIGFLKIHHYI